MCSWASLSFALWIVANLLYSCLSWFNISVRLHAMNWKTFIDFLIGK
jgi:hypothetical protein